jgi:hypothetical protein
MNEATRHKFVWGWLRLFLGWAQMSLAILGGAFLLVVGIRPITWAFVIAAATATIASRLMYRGRKDPRHDDTNTARYREICPTCSATLV